MYALTRRSYGFDPFGLGAVPSNLQRFQEAELVHCRWAMLGAAGALAPELLGLGDWYNAPQWVRHLTGPAPFTVLRLSMFIIVKLLTSDLPPKQACDTLRHSQSIMW